MILALAALAAVRLQEAELPQGVTILESRDLAAELADARRWLEEDNPRPALAVLQKVLEQDPALVIRARPEELLFHGAVAEAHLLLATLPPAAAELREQMLGERARAALQAALDPPDVAALHAVAARYAGSAAAKLAAQALQELLLDQGHPERAAGGRPLGEILPPEWLEQLPAPSPRYPQLTPFYRDLEDPRIPVVRAARLQEQWRYSFRAPPWDSQYSVQLRAAVGEGLVFVTDSIEVAALDLATGAERWRFPGPEGWPAFRSSRGETRRDRRDYGDALDYETLFAPVLEDGVLLAVIQEPVLLGRSDRFRGIAVRRHLPGRRIYAFDAASGALLWRQEVPWLAPGGAQEEPRELVAAAPAAAAGRVFVPVYSATGTVDLSLVALDLHSGVELWRSFLVSGARESNLFGNVLDELACAPPAADAGRVLICTNLGAVCALEAATGITLWTRLYERTRVETFQNGRKSIRQESFVNQPLAYDGARLVCAPSDCPSALALDAATGERLAEWRSQRSSRNELVELRTMVAATSGAGLFFGTHLAACGMPGRGDRYSPPLASTLSASNRSGVLARGEVLVPTPDALLRLDPLSLQPLGSSVPWPQRIVDMGSLQALPGMLLVMNSSGVLAMTSPQGLLESLPAEADPARLAQLLPLLEDLELGGDPGTARRVAEAALRLAQATTNLEQRERLWLAAGRALRDAGAGVDAAAVWTRLLDSAAVERRLTAAAALVVALEQVEPGSALLNRALDVLERGPADFEIEGRDGRSAALIATRARYFQARARGDLDAMRAALTGLLLLPAAEQAREGEQTVWQWAAERRDELLGSRAQRAALEHDAQGALAAGLAPEPFLRAYAGTQAAGDWLQSQTARSDLSRAERVRLAAWLRDYRQDFRLEDAGLSAAELLAAAAPPPLPGALQPLAGMTMRPDSRLLAVRAAPGAEPAAWLLIQEGAACVFGALDRQGWREITRAEVGDGDRAPFLNDRAFLSEAGGVLIYRDSWWSLAASGAVRRFSLPGRADGAAGPVLLGSFLALLCHGSGEMERVQLRDLASGALFYEQVIDWSPAVAQQFLASGGRLFLLQLRNRNAWLFAPLEAGGPRKLEMPSAPEEIYDLEAVAPYGDGVALLGGRDRAPQVALCGPGWQRSFSLPREVVVKGFSTAEGAGWLLQPIIHGRGSVPMPRLLWLPAGADAPFEYDFNAFDLRLPQVEVFETRQQRLPDGHLLALSRTRDDLTRVQALRLGAAGVEQQWSQDLLDLPFQRLVTRRLQPPLHGAGGWALPLVLNSGVRAPAELRVLLFDDQGRLRDHYQTSAGRAPREADLHLLPGLLLVRGESELLLLGDPATPSNRH